MANTHSLDLETGSSQYAFITDGSQTGLDITGDISVVFWIKPESWDEADQVFVGKANVTAQMSWFVESFSSGVIRFGFSNNGSSGDPNKTLVDTNSAELSLGTWTHVGITADVSAGAPGVIIYIDGSPVANTDTVNNATSIFNSTASFAIGCLFTSGTAGNFTDALMDEVGIWNDVRSEAEILANMEISMKNLTPGSDNFVDGWSLDDNYTSVTGNNNLTASGSPVFSSDVPFTGATGNFLPLL